MNANALQALTIVHTLLSFMALFAGWIWLIAILRGSPARRWQGIFLATAAATTLTGFFFPFHGFTPAIGVGVVALITLVIAFAAARHSASSRPARTVLFGMLVLNEYLLVFVAIAQAFGKIPALHAIAPTLKEPPFAVAQGLALVVFVLLGALVLRRRGSPSLGGR